jgi:hypothetical protein
MSALGLMRLQFCSARADSRATRSTSQSCMLGLLGLRIFETAGADIDGLGND